MSSNKDKSKRGGGKVKDTPIPNLTEDATEDVVKETSEDNEIEITKEISSDTRDKKKKKKREISSADISKRRIPNDIDDKSSTSSNDSKNQRKKKKFRAEDTAVNAFAELFGSDESDNEDPKITRYRKLLKMEERIKL